MSIPHAGIPALAVCAGLIATAPAARAAVVGVVFEGNLSRVAVSAHAADLSGMGPDVNIEHGVDPGGYESGGSITPGGYWSASAIAGVDSGRTMNAMGLMVGFFGSGSSAAGVFGAPFSSGTGSSRATATFSYGFTVVASGESLRLFGELVGHPEALDHTDTTITLYKQDYGDVLFLRKRDGTLSFDETIPLDLPGIYRLTLVADSLAFGSHPGHSPPTGGDASFSVTGIVIPSPAPAALLALAAAFGIPASRRRPRM